MAKVQERILKAAKEKQKKNHMKGTLIRPLANFYGEIWPTRREWHFNTWAEWNKSVTSDTQQDFI